MGRKASINWEEATASWRSDVGPKNENGRRAAERWKFPNTAKGRKEAEAALVAYLAERERREKIQVGSSGGILVCEVAAAFIARTIREKKRSTVEIHAERLERWQSFAPGCIRDGNGKAQDVRRACDLGPESLALPLMRLMDEGRSPHYVAGIGRAVKACWAWAAEYDPTRTPFRLLESNPLAAVKLPSVPEAPERYLPPYLAARFLDWIDRRAETFNGISGELERLTALLLRAIYETGARPDELVKAEWGDVDAINCVIVRRDHKTVGHKRRPIRVPLNADLLAAILRAKERPGRHESNIFTHRRGSGMTDGYGRNSADAVAGHAWKVSALGEKFRKLRLAAEADGLDVRVRDGGGHVVAHKPGCTLYDFRRAFTTDADEAGFDDQRIAAAQNNSPGMVSKVYKTRHARRAVEVAEAVAAKRRKA